MSIKYYNKKGYLIEDEFDNNKSIIWRKKYNRKDELIELKEYFKGGIIKTYVFKYDEKGKLIRRKQVKSLIEGLVHLKKIILAILIVVLLLVPALIISSKNDYIKFELVIIYAISNIVLLSFLSIVLGYFSIMIYSLFKNGSIYRLLSDKYTLNKEFYLTILVMFAILSIIIAYNTNELLALNLIPLIP